MAILLHMYRGNRTAYQPLIDPLHQAGFAVLALDLRGHGESGDEDARARVVKGETAVFEEMREDLRAAYNWFAEQPGIDRSRFALVGASIGCSVALNYAADDKSVDVLVLLSPGVDYLGLDSRRPMREIKGRKIWMISGNKPKEKQALAALKKLAPEAKTEVLAGDHHGTHMFGPIPGLEQRIAQYLKANVGKPTNTTVFGSIRSKIYHLTGSGWIEQIRPWNMRHYSSPAEAQSRGLREAKNRGPNDRPGKANRP